ncbi:hypothetical protein [Hungatella hathewayi]|uniref:hypothetical protein n=1 Tax=Hungatella hathewayi TaxID=154046 RepID=UPI003566009C
MKELNQDSKQNKTLMELVFPPYRVAERKIGKSTFTVYSWFGKGKEKDAVSAIARLVQSDHGQP